jgi:hypothetical protein
MNGCPLPFARLAWLGCLLLAGCRGGPGPVAVSGAVTVDGQPLREGSIRFAPADGGTTTQAAHIKDGKFTTLLYRTDYRVQISAPRPKAPAGLDGKGPGGAPTVEELLPARYNSRSELTLTVAGARDDVRFALQSR